MGERGWCFLHCVCVWVGLVGCEIGVVEIASSGTGFYDECTGSSEVGTSSLRLRLTYVVFALPSRRFYRFLRLTSVVFRFEVNIV